MEIRRNNYDVSNSVDTTDPGAVRQEVGRIFQALYPDVSLQLIDRSFADLARLFHG